MSERNTLEKFFTGRVFFIPPYQRDFSWTQENVDDLLDDIDETIDTGTSHYIGTFILSKGDNRYIIVDGQQRLTTLTLLLNAIVARLPEKTKIIKRDAFVFDEGRQSWRLTPAEYNREFFASLLNGKPKDPVSKSQRLLAEAHRYIEERVQAKADANSGNLSGYLEAVQHLEAMEFVEADEGKAIRIFQTVNDRGRPLAIIEKTKSLLIYFSNRLLQGELDGCINELFGQIFRAFTAIKDIGEHPDTRIDLIAGSQFDEDSVLRYHFLSFPFNEDYYDFKPTTSSVLDAFLKPMLKSLQSDREKLRGFIDVYIRDLARFFLDFLALVIRVKTEPAFYKLFCFLNISTHLYPLTIRLQSRKCLDASIGQDSSLTFRDLIEIADLRIYKSKSKDPLKDIAYLAREAAISQPLHVRKRLAQIVQRFMKDSDFASVLTDPDMYSNAGIVHLLMEYGEAGQVRGGGQRYAVHDLVAFKRSQPTVEHIFAQDPTFDLPGRGFENLEQYEALNDCLGNLSVLEREINSRGQNKTPEQKLSEASLFKSSSFDATRLLVSEIAVSGRQFNKAMVESRTTEIAKWCLEKWPLWPEE
jgi:hypothetical protein